jgi:tetratricopeptide (TPR) repeat protein
MADLADLGDMKDPGTAAAVAGYLLAVAEAQSGDSGAARSRAESLLTRQSSPAIKAQLLVLAVQLAVSGADFDAASRFLQEASRSAPESPMLVRLSARLTAAREEAALRSRIDARVAERLKAVDSAASGAEAFAASDALSDLYLARGDVAQALGTYLRFVNRWSDHEKAPAMLSKAILLLPELGEAAGSDRFQSLTSQLMSKYPDSPEALAMKAKATTRN